MIARKMVAKKKPSARSSVKAEATVVAQPAAERRLAEARLDGLVDTFTPGQEQSISAMRRALRKRLPTACEIVYEYRDCFVVSYSPSEHGYEGVLALRGSADGVRLYVTGGKDLPDPAKVLRKAGGQQRWIDLEGAATLARPEVASMIDAAIALNKKPFDSSGKGSVVLSPSTKKRGG